MSRVQLALNVPDLEDAVAFYSKLFATTPNKRKPGYANFAIVDPPLKLVLFESADAPSRLNHLGIEVETTEEVASHQSRLQDAGLAPHDGSGTCCYAAQDKVWVDGPDGAWELYTVLADSESFDCATVPESDTCCS
jgi:catechol 2,3-dioxygenase-like lactoylglutathione lyase family enzyme